MYEICGVILSGGESRRFKSPKAFAIYNEVPFWEHSLHALKEVTKTQIIVSHPTLFDRFTEKSDLPVILDNENVQGKGPMAGMYSAFIHVKAKWYVVVPCDIPLMERKVISRLLDLRSDDITAVIPKIEGRVQPLVGVYHHSIFSKLERLLFSGNFRLMSLLEQINVRYVDENELNVGATTFQNINDLPAFMDLIQKREK